MLAGQIMPLAFKSKNAERTGFSASDPVKPRLQAHSLPRVSRLRLFSSAGVTALILLGAQSTAWASCSPGTFSGAPETCTGTGAQIAATLSANQTVALQGNVTTGGVQLTTSGPISISVTAGSGASAQTAAPAVTPPVIVHTSASPQARPGGGGTTPAPAATSIINSIGGDAINLTSAGGNISLGTGAGVTVSATGSTGDGIDLRTSGSGKISVVTAGNVSSLGGDGVDAVSMAAGSVSVATAGAAIKGYHAGIFAESAGSVSVHSTTGALSASAPNSEGIGVYGGAGGVSVVASGGSISAGYAGISATDLAQSTISITNSDSISGVSEGIAATGDPGVGPAPLGSSITINNSGSMTSLASGAVGIFAGTASGAIAITNAGQVGNSSINNGVVDGIVAQSTNYNTAGIAINNVGAIYTNSASFFNYGIFAVNSGPGKVSITNTGSIVTGGQGIYAAGAGNITVTNGALVIASGGDGLNLTSAGGNISVTTTAGGKVSATGATGDGIYINPTSSPGPQTGSVNVVAGASVSSVNGAGINTVALEGATTITTAAGTTITGGGPNGAIYATSDNGNITINSNGAAVGGVYGMASRAGNVSININGSLTTPGPVAVDANGAGFVKVNLGRNVTVQSTGGGGVGGLGAGASGFELDTAQGSSLISAGQNATVEVTSGGFLLNNSGKLTSTAGGHQGTAVYLLSGAVFSLPATSATINNTSTGVIDGQLVIQNGAITLNNAGLWDANGDSIFGATGALGVANNTGLIQVGLTTAAPPATASTFGGLGAFDNGSSKATGTISMVNGTVGDSLTISSPFVGATGHSLLYLDAYLGGPGSQADELHLLGGSSGKTLIRIHSTNAGAGAVNSQGIVLVTGVTAATDFALDPTGPGYDSKHGGIDQGLFLYSMAFQAGSEVLIGAPNGKATQLATSVTAGQNVFSSAGFVAVSAGSVAISITQPAVAALVERPRAWMSAADNHADDLQSQPVAATLYRAQGELAAPPSMRLSAVQSSGGYDTGYDQGVAMVSGGVDLLRRRSETSALSLGVATAYVQSDQRFSGGAAAMLYSGAVFGGYGLYKAGALHIEGEVKSEVLKAEYLSDSAGADRPNARLTSSGATVSAGYAWRLAPGLRIEPIASAAFQWTTMGDLLIDGSRVRFDPSLRGWANTGVALTGGVKHGGYRVSASLTGLLWDEFGSDNTAYLTALGPGAPMVDRLTGASGEIRGELNVAAGSWGLGFVQASARAGAHQDDFSALTGVRLRW